MEAFEPKTPRKDRPLSYYLAKREKQIASRGFVGTVLIRLLHSVYAKENGVCDYCGSTERPTADHVIPAFLLDMLGFEVRREFREEWLQTLCYDCNRKKGHKLDWSNWRTRPLLQKVFHEASTRN